MAVTYAFSIHTFIDDIGAYAGFAAIVGLALFTLLLFAQARELKRLREWGAHAHDRLADVERRLAGALELARRANAPARAQTTGAASRPLPARQIVPPAPARTAAPGKLPLLPAAPVGVAGPALASATMTIPLPAAPVAVPPAVAPANAPAAAPATSVQQPPPARPGAAPRPLLPAAQPAAAPSLAPATAAAQAPAPATPAPAAPAPPAAPASGNGRADVQSPPLPPQRVGGADRAPSPARPAAGSRSGGARPPVRPGQRPARPVGSARQPAAAPLRSRTPSATPRGGAGAAPPDGRRRLFLLLGAGLALVVAVVAVIVLSTGGSSPSGDLASTPSKTTPATRQTAAAPPHGDIHVAVLNGTVTPGLASTVANELVADGFVTGTVTNASSQDRTFTVVSYYGGHEREAAEVAKTLNVPSDAVQAINPDTEASVCSTGAGTCPETVVVTVGADRQ